MVIKNKNISCFLFMFMIFTASIPYIGYGISQISKGYIIVGSFSRNTDLVVKYTGRFGQAIAFLKDISCALLLLDMIINIKTKKKSGKTIMSFFVIIIIGFLILAFNNRVSFNYMVAGIRCFLFVITTIVFCQEYSSSIVEKVFIRIVTILMDITLLIQLIITVMQIQSSSSWSRFGTGSYRFCGVFPGSGNLGCYCIALQLLYLLILKKFSLISNKGMILRSFVCVFLSVASGTRTTMILCSVIFLYYLTEMMLKKIRFGFWTILILAIIFVLTIGVPVFNWFIQRTNRGELELSGGGRITLFMNMVHSANSFQVVFGRGLGIGTNASVTMGVGKAELADSTINLMFIQYGFAGLVLFLAGLLKAGFEMWKKVLSSERGVVVLFFLVIIVMLFVGNLFEHIAMSIILTFTYYLVITPLEEIENGEKRNNCSSSGKAAFISNRRYSQ